MDKLVVEALQLVVEGQGLPQWLQSVEVVQVFGIFVVICIHLCEILHTEHSAGLMVLVLGTSCIL